MRTLTAYGIGVVIVLAILNGIFCSRKPSATRPKRVLCRVRLGDVRDVYRGMALRISPVSTIGAGRAELAVGEEAAALAPSRSPDPRNIPLAIAFVRHAVFPPRPLEKTCNNHRDRDWHNPPC